jgi:hypothetical protein
LRLVFSKPVTAAHAVINNRGIQAITQILHVTAERGTGYPQRFLNVFKGEASLVIKQLVNAVKAFSAVQDNASLI